MTDTANVQRKPGSRGGRFVVKATYQIDPDEYTAVPAGQQTDAQSPRDYDVMAAELDRAWHSEGLSRDEDESDAPAANLADLMQRAGRTQPYSLRIGEAHRDLYNSMSHPSQGWKSGRRR
jgi:hypothetical protein